MVGISEIQTFFRQHRISISISLNDCRVFYLSWRSQSAFLKARFLIRCPVLLIHTVLYSEAKLPDHRLTFPDVGQVFAEHHVGGGKHITRRCEA